MPIKHLSLKTPYIIREHQCRRPTQSDRIIALYVTICFMRTRLEPACLSHGSGTKIDPDSRNYITIFKAKLLVPGQWRTTQAPSSKVHPAMYTILRERK